MKLIFAGTKGYIDLESPEHRRHSVLLLEHRGRTVQIDNGQDWVGHREDLGSPEALVITHAHPDHAGGLKQGWDGPVWATAEAWQAMLRFPVPERRTLEQQTATAIGGMVFTAFPVIHSIRAPAVGLRVRAGRATIFYVPDVLSIEDHDDALCAVDVYIGDGATLKRDLVRTREDRPFGHVSVRQQLTWCAAAGIRRAVFTHCGSGIVRDHRAATGFVEAFGQAVGVEASIATDGLILMVRS